MNIYNDQIPGRLPSLDYLTVVPRMSERIRELDARIQQLEVENTQLRAVVSAVKELMDGTNRDDGVLNRDVLKDALDALKGET